MERFSVKISDLIKNKKLESSGKENFISLSYTKRFKKKKFLRKVLPKRKKTKSEKIINYLKFPKMEKKSLYKRKINKSLQNIKLKKDRVLIIKNEMKKIKILNKNFDEKIKAFFQNKKLYKEKLINYKKNEKTARKLENLNFQNPANPKKSEISKNLSEKIVFLKNLHKLEKKKEKTSLKSKILLTTQILKRNKSVNFQKIPKTPYTTKFSKKFLQACKLGQNQIIQQLLKIDKSLIYQFDYFNLTGLHWAVKRNRFSTAKILVKNKAFLDFRDFKGRTCLFYAFENMNIEMIFFLFQNDASPVLDRERDFSEVKEKLGFGGKVGLRDVGKFFVAKKGNREFFKHYIDQVARDN